mmetsp:Transcript_23893/g.81481  ORF Transcript_23893/g.81481 Transcript_23893/m.81481 type:complete len:388 (+) Transcript_23893:1153-2316(+)
MPVRGRLRRDAVRGRAAAAVLLAVHGAGVVPPAVGRGRVGDEHRGNGPAGGAGADARRRQIRPEVRRGGGLARVRDAQRAVRGDHGQGEEGRLRRPRAGEQGRWRALRPAGRVHHPGFPRAGVPADAVHGARRQGERGRGARRGAEQRSEQPGGGRGRVRVRGPRRAGGLGGPAAAEGVRRDQVHRALGGRERGAPRGGEPGGDACQAGLGGARGAVRRRGQGADGGRQRAQRRVVDAHHVRALPRRAEGGAGRGGRGVEAPGWRGVPAGGGSRARDVRGPPQRVPPRRAQVSACAAAGGGVLQPRSPVPSTRPSARPQALHHLPARSLSPCSRPAPCPGRRPTWAPGVACGPRPCRRRRRAHRRALRRARRPPSQLASPASPAWPS